MESELKAKLFPIGPPTIVFRPDVAASHDQEIIYTGKIHGDELKIWAQEKCIPLVRFVFCCKYFNRNESFFSQFLSFLQRNYI